MFYEAFRVAAVKEDDYISKLNGLTTENKRLRMVEQDYRTLRSKYSTILDKLKASRDENNALKAELSVLRAGKNSNENSFNTSNDVSIVNDHEYTPQ